MSSFLPWDFFCLCGYFLDSQRQVPNHTPLSLKVMWRAGTAQDIPSAQCLRNCVIASNSQGKSCSTEHVALSPYVVLSRPSLVCTIVTFPCRQRFYLIMSSVRKEKRCILSCFVLVRGVFIYFEVSWILKQAWFPSVSSLPAASVIYVDSLMLNVKYQDILIICKFTFHIFPS